MTARIHFQVRMFATAVCNTPPPPFGALRLTQTEANVTCLRCKKMLASMRGTPSHPAHIDVP